MTHPATPAQAAKPAPTSLVIGVSTSALFDTRETDRIFREQGEAAYRAHMLATADQPLPKGTVWPFVEKLLRFNAVGDRHLDVIILSRNSPLSLLRVQNSLRHHGLMHDSANCRIHDYAASSGRPLHPFLKPFKIDLFLSTDAGDVQAAIDQGIAAAVVSAAPPATQPDPTRLHVAFDFDGVLADEDSDRRFVELVALHKNNIGEAVRLYCEHEAAKLDVPLNDGPFAGVLRKMARLRDELPRDVLPIEISMLTARASIPLERALRTLRGWGIDPDQLVTFGVKPHIVQKADALRLLKPDLFLDDTQKHVDLAQHVAPTGKVPWPQRPLKATPGAVPGATPQPPAI